ncbi:MAG: GNAT family N-acetyltransferase [Hyphomicrobiaceae bacterium]|nr:MAG: GNAT family N-acetyltransferase [Hyphomicrobiaceae bacterium]
MHTSLGELVKRPACYGDIAALQACDSAYPELVEWRAKDFKHCIRDEAMECSIVEVGGIFAGYMVIETYVSSVEIWRLVVDRQLLRCQIGSCLVRGVCSRLMLPRKGVPKHGMRNVIVDVPEENLRAQLFFKSLGFRARLPIVRDDEFNLYRMVYEQFGGRFC